MIPNIPSRQARRARRAAVKLPLHIHRASGVEQGHTVNISRTGLLFTTQTTLRTHEFCILSVHTAEETPVDLAGQVVRASHGQEPIYALNLRGHQAQIQQSWEELLNAVFRSFEAQGALHLKPSYEILTQIHHCIVHREPLWLSLGRPAPLHVPFSLIMHHPISKKRFSLPVFATSNRDGLTLLELSSSTDPALPHELMYFISAFTRILHS